MIDHFFQYVNKRFENEIIEIGDNCQCNKIIDNIKRPLLEGNNRQTDNLNRHSIPCLQKG